MHSNAYKIVQRIIILILKIRLLHMRSPRRITNLRLIKNLRIIFVALNLIFKYTLGCWKQLLAHERFLTFIFRSTGNQSVFEPSDNRILIPLLKVLKFVLDVALCEEFIDVVDSHFLGFLFGLEVYCFLLLFATVQDYAIGVLLVVFYPFEFLVAHRTVFLNFVREACDLFVLGFPCTFLLVDSVLRNLALSVQRPECSHLGKRVYGFHIEE